MSTPTPLTDAQIEALYAFVKSKYVDYYDVQLELVDHLASEVEQRMAANPAVSFETALQQVYAGFGIFGFTDLVTEKGKAVNLKNRNLLWQAFKSLFRLPKIAGSLLLLVALMVAFDLLSPSLFLLVNGTLVLLVDVVVIYYFFGKRPRKGYKLVALQYNSLLHFGATFNLYQTYFISYVLLLPNLEGSWLLLIPGLCWLGWINFAADALALEALYQEQQKLYPMAFA
jgi:hypothetical protein